MKTVSQPNKWTTESLGAVATIERTGVAPEQIRTGTTYVGLENIESGGRFVGVGPVANGELASTKFSFSPSHVLYGKLRPYLAKIACPDFEGVCSTDILPILPGAKLDRRYLCYYLRQPNTVEYATSRCTGANLPRLSPSTLEEFQIPLPPLAEQRRIADILDKADAIRRKRREAISALAEMKRATFLALFGDPGTNPRGWSRSRISGLLASDRSGTRCGPFGTALNKSEYLSAGVPVWGIDNVLPDRFREEGALYISESKYEVLAAYSVKPGDLLISRAGSVGRICVANPSVTQSIIGTNLIRVCLDHKRLCPEYLSSMLTLFPGQAGQLRASSDSDSYSFMKTSVLEKLEIPVPEMHVQQEYLAFLRSHEQMIKNSGKSMQSCEQMFASLAQRAFRGAL